MRPMAYCREHYLPIQLPPIRPGLSPMGFYQDLKAGSSSWMGTVNAIDSVYRQYSLIGRVLRDVADQVSSLVSLLQCLGFTINTDKYIIEPAKSIEFLGFTVNTVTIELSLPARKLKKIWVESRKLLEARQVSTHALFRLFGRLNAANQVIPSAPLFYRHI